MSLVSLTEASSSLAQEAVNVDFDVTVIGQVVLFVLLMVVLKPLLFDPMLKLFEERERRIDGARLEARGIDEVSAGALSKYESEMQKARAAATKEREKLRADGLRAENEILAKVRTQTADTVDRGRQNVAEQVAKARAELAADAQALAREVAGRVLGREVQG
jgi:F-type H+-transporting ATPase subunit b